MEEPGSHFIILYNQMRQMFPEISQDVIHFHVARYGSSPEVCKHNLNLYRQYNASTQALGHTSIIDTSVTDHLSNLMLNTSDKEALKNASRQKSPFDLSINCNQESRNYSDHHYPPPPRDYVLYARPYRNYSYAGMENLRPMNIASKIPPLSAPVNSANFECFNDAYRNRPGYTAHVPMSNVNSSDRVLGTSPSNTGAAVNSSVSPYSNVPSLHFSHLPVNVSSNDQCKQQSLANASPPIRTPFDSQLQINVEPSYTSPQFPQPDQEALSILSNYQYWRQSAQPFALAPTYVHPVGSPRIQNEVRCLEELLRPPQLSIHPLYTNQNSLRTAIPEDQHQNRLHIPVSGADERPFYSYHIQGYILRQIEKSEFLNQELTKLKDEADLRKEEINKLEQQLRDKRFLPTYSQVKELKKDNSKLGTECNVLCMEVDKRSKGSALLGMVTENFYRNIFTGQQGPILPTPPVSSPDPNSTSPIVGVDDQRPPSSDEEEENQESKKWKCSSCTFANHPAISACEICHMPRISPGLGEPDAFLKCDSKDSPGKQV